MVLGTPAYSAPEAIEAGTFSVASDQFSFAATMYEAISGQRAFPGDDAVSVASRITSSDPAPIAEALGLDAHVDSVLFRAMAKTPARRFASAEDFAAALAEALGVSAARAALPTLPDRLHTADEERERERSQLLAAGVGALVGALLVAALFLLWPSEQARSVDRPGDALGSARTADLPRTSGGVPSGSALPRVGRDPSVVVPALKPRAGAASTKSGPPTAPAALDPASRNGNSASRDAAPD
jgi:serine/threonine-protein kinase